MSNIGEYRIMQNQLDKVIDRYLLRVGDDFWDYIASAAGIERLQYELEREKSIVDFLTQQKGGPNNYNRSIYTIVQYCHTDICQLDLEKLLQSDDSQFMHDMSGILGDVEDKHSHLPLGGFLPHCRVIS